MILERLFQKHFHLKHMTRQRLFVVVRTAAMLMAAGCAYGIFLHFTGIGFVCPVRFVTGWKCPGCGVTHMCLALLRLDLAAAFMANPALFLSVPLLVIIFIPYVVCYIRTGKRQTRPWQDCALWLCIVVLVLYGVARNLFSLP